jgi:hypothetical protein
LFRRGLGQDGEGGVECDPQNPLSFVRSGRRVPGRARRPGVASRPPRFGVEGCPGPVVVGQGGLPPRARLGRERGQPFGLPESREESRAGAADHRHRLGRSPAFDQELHMIPCAGVALGEEVLAAFRNRDAHRLIGQLFEGVGEGGAGVLSGGAGGAGEPDRAPPDGLGRGGRRAERAQALEVAAGAARISSEQRGATLDVRPPQREPGIGGRQRRATGLERGPSPGGISEAEREQGRGSGRRRPHRPVAGNRRSGRTPGRRP